MKLKSIFLILAAMAVAGCTTHATIDASSNLDPYQRTIMMNATDGMLAVEVKNVFQNNDWQVGDSHYRLPTPRYALQLSFTQTNVCLPNFDPKYDYDLVITDLRMGGHVFAMHGTDCRHTILDQLDAYIKNRPGQSKR